MVKLFSKMSSVDVEYLFLMAGQEGIISNESATINQYVSPPRGEHVDGDPAQQHRGHQTPTVFAGKPAFGSL